MIVFFLKDSNKVFGNSFMATLMVDLLNIVVNLYSPAFRDTLVNSIRKVSSAACLSIFAGARHWRIMSWLLLGKEFREHCTSLDAP